MYKLRTEINKVANVKIPDNPSKWTTEILKNIRRIHPYINLSDVNIKISNNDVKNKKMSGIVIIGKKAVVPFCIKESKDKKNMELSDLDVIFDGQRFRALNKDSFAEILASDVGTLHDPQSSGDGYVGHLTGDVSPLEFSPYSNGGMVSYASLGVMYKLIRDENDLSYLHNFLQGHPRIRVGVNITGLKHSLEQLQVEPTENKSDVVVLSMDGGNIKATFSDGGYRHFTLLDIKDALQEDFRGVMDAIQSVGWAILDSSGIPESNGMTISLSNESLDSKGFLASKGNAKIPSMYHPIQTAGPHSVKTKDGRHLQGNVYTHQVSLDGSINPIQTFISSGREWALGSPIVGTREKRISQYTNRTPGSPISPGGKGVFISPCETMCTVPVVISNIINAINGDIHVIGSVAGFVYGIVPTMGLSTVFPMKRTSEMPDYLPESVVLVPTSWRWASLNGIVDICDRDRPAENVSRIHRDNNNLFNMTLGNTEYLSLSRDAAISALYNHGMSPAQIQEFVETSRPGERFTAVGFSSGGTQFVKVAKREYLKIAEEFTDAVETGGDELRSDPQILSSLISLQFISEDNLEDLSGCEDEFLDIEDKIAKMLMAAREGEESLNESSLKKALKGISGAIQGIRNLRLKVIKTR